MAKHAFKEVVDGEEIHTDGAQEMPKTIGAAFPGFARAVAGVETHDLPLGLLAMLAERGIEAIMTRAEAYAARGTTKDDDEEENKRLRAIGRQEALTAFASGVLPGSIDDEGVYILKEAAKFIQGTAEAQANKSHDYDAFMAAWYDARMTEDEKDGMSKPRNQSRSNCVRRIARDWLVKDGLPEAAEAKRAAVVEAGKAAYRDAAAQAKAKVVALGATLLDPAGTPNAAPSMLGAEAVEMGF